MTEQPRSKALTTVGKPVLPLIPTTVDECWQMAKYFSQSGVIPSTYPGQPGSDQNVAAVFGALQMGATVGLPPMASLGTIMVFGGRYAMYGDGQLAVVRGSGILEKFKETYIGDEPKGDAPLDDWPEDFAAVCEIKIKDSEGVTETFTVADAKRAKLWGKKTKNGGDTPWITSPKRMLRYRCRAFILRDNCGEVLLGLQHSAEELMDMGELLEQGDGVFAPANAEVPAEAPRREDYDEKPTDEADLVADPEPESDPWEFVDAVGEVTECESYANFYDELAGDFKRAANEDVIDLLWENNEATLTRLHDEREDLYQELEQIRAQTREKFSEPKPPEVEPAEEAEPETEDSETAQDEPADEAAETPASTLQVHLKDDDSGPDWNRFNVDAEALISASETLEALAEIEQHPAMVNAWTKAPGVVSSALKRRIAAQKKKLQPSEK